MGCAASTQEVEETDEERKAQRKHEKKCVLSRLSHGSATPLAAVLCRCCRKAKRRDRSEAKDSDRAGRHKGKRDKSGGKDKVRSLEGRKLALNASVSGGRPRYQQHRARPLRPLRLLPPPLARAAHFKLRPLPGRVRVVCAQHPVPGPGAVACEAGRR